MKLLRILGIILIVLGAGSFTMSVYIQSEVNQGRVKIRNAQETVDGAKGITKVTPFTKGFGDVLTDSAQKKIDAGRQDADKYQTMASWLKGLGISFFIIGALMLFVSFFYPKKRQ